MTFLAIDVGNTRLKWALYQQPRPGAALIAQGAEFLEHIERLAEGPWAELPSPKRMLGCIVAGDAPRRRVEEQMELWDVAAQWVVASPSEAGLVNGYDHPARLGADQMNQQTRLATTLDFYETSRTASAARTSLAHQNTACLRH